MRSILIPQADYDHLIISLRRNGKALNNDYGYRAAIERIDRHKRTEREGVYVRADALDVAYRMIKSNIGRNGRKYGSEGDEVLLMNLDDVRAEAIEHPAEAAAEPAQSTEAVEEISDIPAHISPHGHPPLPKGAYTVPTTSTRYTHPPGSPLREITATVEQREEIWTDDLSTPAPDGWYWSGDPANGYQLLEDWTLPDVD